MKNIRVIIQGSLIIFASVIISLLPITTRAAVPAWQIVPNESSITFTATQNNAPVTGKFVKFTGDIHVDPNQLDASKVRIVVDMGSVSTSYSDLTATLITSDWFDTNVFPQAVFTSTKIIKTGDKTYQASGTLTIRNKTVPITLLLTQEMYSTSKAQVKGSTVLKRTLFDIGQGEWTSTNEVKDDVQVNFILTVTKVL